MFDLRGTKLCSARAEEQVDTRAKLTSLHFLKSIQTGFEVANKAQKQSILTLPSETQVLTKKKS
jgi:hypothetical protein